MLRALVRSTATATRAAPLLQHARGAQHQITRIGVDDPRMSRVVVHRGIVYTLGVTAADAGDDITTQTTATLKKVDELLASAGTDKSRALTSMIWLRDISRDFKAMNEVWNGWVDPENKPTRATVQAEMARPSILVEIQVTAAVDE
eukprot:CAMPEP_0174721252 /NCGR_PEP_ID=MMETSP1094-20130205/35695_1 /TAXON_ID=156173 /ORGANISM="Chrysochromulina brevifilum, Strain UTEX LB 985" /LENGTH=145 /DNA_ID=CAMNT_0015921905 /DNA_START=19 /DNA_END=456 /DNA_ORIENTATION=-